MFAQQPQFLAAQAALTRCFTDSNSGTVMLSSFEDQTYKGLITIDGSGDSSQIAHEGSRYFLTVSNPTITVGLSDIAALVFSIIDPVEVFVDNQIDIAGFLNASPDAVGGIMTQGFVLGPMGLLETNAFTTYDLSTTLTAMGYPLYGGAFLTSAGEDLFAVSNNGNSTFSAVTNSSAVSTPEPGTMALIGIGLVR